MDRRSFLSVSAAAGATLCLPAGLCAQPSIMAASTVLAPTPARRDSPKLLILVELKGGNDGLNTVIPFADPAYYRLRKNIGVQREQAIQLDGRTALHPSLLPLMPMWRNRQLAIVQGVGYAQPNLSHFRSMQIWDTASRADEYLHDGWLTRAFAQAPASKGASADRILAGSAEMGPLTNCAQVLTLPEAPPFSDASKDPARANKLRGSAQTGPRLKTVFPWSAFGRSIDAAMRFVANGSRTQAHSQSKSQSASQSATASSVSVIRLTLNGFDTHHNQADRHRLVLKDLAEGLSAMQSALVELGRWDDTLVMTYAEFGRSARENGSHGTDHGTAAAHVVTGGRVLGGLYGTPPDLGRLDGNGNLSVGVDFRRLYATALGPWWGLDAPGILQRRFEPLPLLRV